VKDFIAFMLLLPLLLFFLIQPMLHYVEGQRGERAQIILEKATERAAIEGRYSPSIISDIVDEVEKMGYKEEDIKLRLTTDLTNRGDYVTGTLVVPNKFFFMLSPALLGFDEDKPLYHVATASRMSEHIN